MTIMYAITILPGGIMAPQTTKGVHPFILTILSFMDGNLKFKDAVHADMMYIDVFVNRNMHYVPMVVRSMYVHSRGGKPTAAEIVGPIMFNPAFILQIIAQTGGNPEMGHGGKGDIWDWSGVERHYLDAWYSPSSYNLDFTINK